MRAKRSGILLSVVLLLVASAPSQPVGAQELDTVIFNVRGLWSEFCEWYVEESLLGDIDGLDSAHADHEADTVTVVFDPTKLTLEQLAAAIEDCPFIKVTESTTHELNRAEIRRHRRCWCCFASRDDGRAPTTDRSS